jgi:hypothetical protein
VGRKTEQKPVQKILMENGYFQDWNCLEQPVTAEDERYNGSSSANEESGIAVLSDLENPAPSYVYV